MSELIFLEPVFQEKIWGGNKLATVFNYELTSDKIGECWAISAHPNGSCTIANGKFKGLKLNELWDNHREVFGNVDGEVFPLLTKILTAADDLSVQVHPDDEYGLANESELGKTECWYIIAADEDAEIIYGHHAKNKTELAQMLEHGQWEQLLRKVKVKAGDFFFVPSGTIHAIGKGIMILETQQSSDTTYRLYDYDRKDDAGNPRELHLQQSIDVTTVPHIDAENKIEIQQIGASSVETLVKTLFFDVYKWNIQDHVEFTKMAPYTLVSVLNGSGTIKIADKVSEIKMGDHFIIPSDIEKWEVAGEMNLIASNQGVR